MAHLPSSAAADRNKQPILDVLRRVLGQRGTALEIASGTGQHAAWFAAALGQWIWQPSDADAGMLPALAERVAQAGLANLRPPLLLDVMSPRWLTQDAGQRFDAIYCANMLHIAPAAAGDARRVARAETYRLVGAGTATLSISRVPPSWTAARTRACSTGPDSGFNVSGSRTAT